MENEPEELHMLRLFVEIPTMYRIAEEGGVDMDMATTPDYHGYLAHAAMSAAFDWGDDDPGVPDHLKHAHHPKPFVIRDESGGDRHVEVRAYSEHGVGRIQQSSHLLGGHPDVINWDRSESKKMPDRIDEGRYTFRVRCCPVVRKASSGDRWDEGDEIDAFLDRVHDVDEDTYVDRERVYLEWLARQLDVREGGATLVEGKVSRFNIARMRSGGSSNGASVSTRHSDSDSWP